jgi:hypothetical protein
MRKICLLFVALLVTNITPAQFHKNYTWEKSPKVYKPTAKQSGKSDILVVFEKSFYETVYEADGQAVIIETVHSLYHVNNTKGIDITNKNYISMSGVIEELDLRARCITADNKVIDLNKSTIKEVDDLEGAGPYKIFVVDGVEVGCDVEVLHTYKKNYYSYSYFHIPSRNPILYYETHILSPLNLVYETKTYNGLEPFVNDTTDKERNHQVLIKKDMEPMEEEKYSAGKANFPGFLVQLNYNTNKNKSKLVTWDIISREYYAGYYNPEKSQMKALKKSYDKIKISVGMSTEEKVRAIENYLKNNFEINASYKSIGFEKAIELKKFATVHCLAYLINAFKYFNIPFEFVLTSDRGRLKFDPKFASYLYAAEYLFYFPELKKYLSPDNIYSRLGFPDFNVINNEGLFIKEVSIGEINSASAKTKFINGDDVTGSSHNTDVTVKLDLNDKTVALNVTQTQAAYSAYFVQPIYRFLNDEQKKEIDKAFYITSSTDVKNTKVTNVEEGDILVKPMIATYSLTENDLLEQAGNKFIFKAGLLIGPQAELYQENERKFPADMNYPHSLKRVLEINLPDGYKAINLNDLKINKTCMVGGKEVATFVSDYQVNGDKIIVNIFEDYKMIEYPLANFTEFKAVINAAADFNKKNIIFEKK